MKFHTSLTSTEIVLTLRRTQDQGLIARDLTMTVFEPGPSMTHRNSFEIQLGTYDRDSLPAGYTDQNGRVLRVRRARNSPNGSAPYAATWHEWGWFIAALFAADPGSRWGTNPARSRSPRPWGYFSPDDFHDKTGGRFRPAGSGEPAMPATLRVFREDGTEVQPGDEITMAGIGEPFTFRAALRASNASGIDGLITAEKAGRNYPDLYSAPFGLVVREVTSDQSEPAWTTGMAGCARRDIRGPGGFSALVGPAGGWLIIDSSDGTTAKVGFASTQEDAKQAVAGWEREHGLIPGDVLSGKVVPDLSGLVLQLSPSSQPELHERLAAAVTHLDGDYEPSRQPEPATLDAALSVVDHNKTELTRTHDAGAEDDSSERDAYLGALEALADAVHDYLSQEPGRTEAMAAEADRIARTMAPPVPGVTRNNGCVVYSVLEVSTRVWYVAAMRESDGERVTWRAEAASDGTLVFSSGNYHTRGQGSADEALADLAVRGGVLGALDRLSSGVATREAYRESYEQVLAELSGVHDVGRARVRSGLLEAAALGYARISWHSGGVRKDYGIRYDRYRCVFTYLREH